jgi:hypothetical protein
MTSRQPSSPTTSVWQQQDVALLDRELRVTREETPAEAPDTMITVATETLGVLTNGARPGDEAERHLKDEVLARLSHSRNVAQFVSFGPGALSSTRYVRIRGLGTEPLAAETAIDSLLERTVEKRVNVRSFRLEQPKSHEFIYGLASTSDALAAVRRLSADGLYTIVNETIDVSDGGVSGVSYGSILEFAPEDTPRCVEKPGTAALPAQLGLALLETIYGFRPALDTDPAERVEFSIHPLRRGYHHDHTIVWELERYEPLELSPIIVWPNRFSRFIGDKTFGLLIAESVGLFVPQTTVVARRVAPFTFGRPTGTDEVWIRTAPKEQVPGKFTTRHGWTDPFELLQNEDETGASISAVLSQEGVDARYSGVAATDAAGKLTIEGVRGYGAEFMQGKSRPSALPRNVLDDVESAYIKATALGEVRFEWVHDGRNVWVVQLHRGALPGTGRTIYPGEPSHEHRFNITQGLEALRNLAERVRGTGAGIVLVGAVGVTSHFGDVLRRARIPSRLEEA